MRPCFYIKEHRFDEGWGMEMGMETGMGTGMEMGMETGMEMGMETGMETVRAPSLRLAMFAGVKPAMLV